MKRIIAAVSLSFCIAGPAAAAIIDVYGAPGSFGTLGATVQTGQSVTQNGIMGWQLDPGQAAFFPAVASDGTVFMPNLPQTDNELFPSACDMAVTCFNPTAAVCMDAVTGSAQNFGTIRIPTGAGNTFIPAGGCASLQGVCSGGTCSNGKVGHACTTNLDCEARSAGADISDMEVIPDTGSGESVVFNSVWGSSGSASSNVFPLYGALKKAAGAWGLDPTSTRTPLQFQQSNMPVSSQACPTNGLSGQPSCNGLAEMVRLPVSGRVAVTQYFGGIMVIDSGGTILAYYALPTTPDPCNPSTNLSLNPREVDADPTSVANDERFVVVYDIFNGTTNSQPAQEFRYNEAAGTITPISAPIYTGSATNPAAGCGLTRQVEATQYDHKGNLWVARSTQISGGPVDVYLKDSTTGKRKLETDCGATNPYGFVCTADLETGLANITSTASPNWIVPWETHLLEDPTSGTMFVITFGGEVVPIQLSATTDGSPLTLRNKITLNKDLLKPPRTAVCSNSPSTVCSLNSNCPAGGVCLFERRDATKGIVDSAHRGLWVPIMTAENIGPDGCSFFNCEYEVGQVRDAWLYRLDIDQTLAFGVSASQIQSPSVVTAGLSFTITVTSNLTDALDTSKSFVAAYVNGSGTPTSPIAWSRSCSGGSCTFTASVPGSVTTGTTGWLVWHAFLANAGSSKSLHMVGRAKIVAGGCQ